MSITEILAELPSLNTEERNAIVERIGELDNWASPDMLTAIAEADESPKANDVSADQLQDLLKQWTFTKQASPISR